MQFAQIKYLILKNNNKKKTILVQETILCKEQQIQNSQRSLNFDSTLFTVVLLFFNQNNLLYIMCEKNCNCNFN